MTGKTELLTTEQSDNKAARCSRAAEIALQEIRHFVKRR